MGGKEQDDQDGVMEGRKKAEGKIRGCGWKRGQSRWGHGGEKEAMGSLDCPALF